MPDSDFDPFAQFSQALEKRPEPKPYIPQVGAQPKPKSVDESSSPTPLSHEGKRPKLLWWIAAFYSLAFVFTLLSYAAYRKDWVRLPADDQTFITELGPVTLVFTLILMSVNLYAVIRLFQLRAEAARLLLLTFSAGIIYDLFLAFTTNWLQNMTNRPGGLLNFLLGILINVGIIYYAFRLKRKGVLKTLADW